MFFLKLAVLTILGLLSILGVNSLLSFFFFPYYGISIWLLVGTQVIVPLGLLTYIFLDWVVGS
jgi:hypothetical protein